MFYLWVKITIKHLLAWRLACTKDKDVADYGKENVNIVNTVAEQQHTTQTQGKNSNFSGSQIITEK